MDNAPINEAIKKAALRIRARTHYEFLTTTKPTDEKGQACLLGWIGYYLGLPDDPDYPLLVAKTLYPGTSGASSMLQFFAALEQIDKGDWDDNNFLASKVLKKYADQAFPI
jgi:hypothetical protein